MAAFVAAGGAATQAGAAARPGSANVMGVISSYYGPLQLMDKFEQCLKVNEVNSFQKFYKADMENAVQLVQKFSDKSDVAPPPGFGD